MAYTRNLSLIKAQQKAWEYRHYGRQMKVLDFEGWFREQLNHFEEIGAEVEFAGQVMFVKYPGASKFGAFTRDEFYEEYLTTYLRQKKPHTCLEGCSA